MQQGPTLLDRELWFPAHDSALTVPEGLLAIGGDLSPARLLLAYENGIFPWFEDGQPILWWSPPIRAIVLPENFVPSRSLKNYCATRATRPPSILILSESLEAAATTVWTMAKKHGLPIP